MCYKLTAVEATLESVQSTADYYDDQNILASYHRFHFGEGFLVSMS
jgi:hypothetical protein